MTRLELAIKQASEFANERDALRAEVERLKADVAQKDVSLCAYDHYLAKANDEIASLKAEVARLRQERPIAVGDVVQVDWDGHKRWGEIRRVHDNGLFDIDFGDCLLPHRKSQILRRAIRMPDGTPIQ